MERTSTEGEQQLLSLSHSISRSARSKATGLGEDMLKTFHLSYRRPLQFCLTGCYDVRNVRVIKPHSTQVRVIRSRWKTIGQGNNVLLSLTS